MENYVADHEQDQAAPHSSTSTELLTLPRLIAWLETKNPAERYDSMDACHCLFAQYFQSVDPQAASLHLKEPRASWLYVVNGERINAEPLWGVAISGGPDTFGNALERAKEMLAESNQ